MLPCLAFRGNQQIFVILFQKQIVLKKEQEGLSGFISRLEDKLRLTFIESEEGNVCMANRNSELRNEFKQSFTLSDVQRYITTLDIKPGEPIPLPENATAFFNPVKI